MNNRLVKNFILDERIRPFLVFSDVTKIRLNTEDPSNPRLMLKANAGLYSTDNDIWVKTPLMTPQAVKKWLAFEATYLSPAASFDLPVGTSLGFKVRTTGNDKWWDGGAWVDAGASDWMTEAVLSTNLPTFPIATIGNKSIGLVVNLKTTDPKLTPEVKELKFLGDFAVEWFEDLVYDSLIRKLNTEFRSSSVLAFQTTGPINSIDLGTVLENKGYNITGIRSVYNVTDDPLKLTDLFDSYTPGAAKQDGFTFESGTVGFTSSVPADKILEITFEFVPEVVVMTGQDFYEIPVYPSIVIDSIQSVERRGLVTPDTHSFGEDYVRNKADLTAVFQYSPRVFSLHFEFSVFTNKQRDQMRITDDLNRFFSQNKTLKTWGLEVECALQIVDEINTSGNQNAADNADTNVAAGSFDVLGVPHYHKPSLNVPLVGPGQVNIDTTLLN